MTRFAFALNRAHILSDIEMAKISCEKLQRECCNKQARLSVLADLERRTEKVRSEIPTPAENAIARHQLTPLVDGIEIYVAYLPYESATLTALRRHRPVCLKRPRLTDHVGYQWSIVTGKGHLKVDGVRCTVTGRRPGRVVVEVTANKGIRSVTD